MRKWQLQEAKAQMSELIKKAQRHPQDVTLHGKSVAVVVSRETFDRLSHGQISLVDFMRQSPLHDIDEVVLEREQTKTRKVEF